MRAFAKYSTPALAGLITFAVACGESTAPDTKRLPTEPSAPAEGRNSGDRPPTTPTSLRITATGARSVSLAWNASTDNSGDFTYRIVRSGGSAGGLPGWLDESLRHGHTLPLGSTRAGSREIADAASPGSSCWIPDCNAFATANGRPSLTAAASSVTRLATTSER